MANEEDGVGAIESPPPADDVLTPEQLERKRLMEEATALLGGGQPITAEEAAEDNYINVQY